MSIAKLDSSPERESYICILMDEIHVKSDLVYDKHSGEYPILHIAIYVNYNFLSFTCM